MGIHGNCYACDGKNISIGVQWTIFNFANFENSLRETHNLTTAYKGDAKNASSVFCNKWPFILKPLFDSQISKLLLIVNGII